MSKEALIIFTKNPELGKVKTRLAKAIGDEKALVVYKKLIRYTQKITAQSDIDLVIYYSQSIRTDDGWDGASKKIQPSGNLGRKMSEAFKNELAQYEKVCIIGTDCAELTSTHILEAFAQLDYHDFVLGPANDGGYYLLGMKVLDASLFEDIKWSSELVLGQTIDKIENSNKTYYLLPELIDVDTIDDWKMVMENFDDSF